MISYAKSKGMDWGTIDTLPEIIGVALHKDGHVGYKRPKGFFFIKLPGTVPVAVERDKSYNGLITENSSP